MELLDVLDSNGMPTGKILDKDQIHRDGLFHREVALILLNDKGDILLQKRDSTKMIEPNKWAWHGGHVMAGESTLEAVLRETKEELGIELDPNKVKVLIELKRDKMPNRQFTTAYYARCTLNVDDFDIQKEELSEVRWFDFNEFEEMIHSNHPDMMFKDNENTNKIISAIKQVL